MQRANRDAMTAIPALLPPASQPTTQPYLTAAQFKAYPTWLDLDNLVPNGIGSLQDDALTDALLAASALADDMCEGMRLGAHYVQNEQLTAREACGRITLQPRDVPLNSVVSLLLGWDPSALAALSIGPATFWNEAGRLVSFTTGGPALQFTGPAIQFGQPALPNGRIYVSWSYTAGFVTSVLSASCIAGASSITLADPTCVMPGQTLRIYDEGEDASGASEALTVAASYIPQVPTVPPTATSIPLAAPATFAHAAGTGITGFPRQALQAVYALGVAVLMREDVSADEPDTGFGPAARRTIAGNRGSGAASGLYDDARIWLDKFRPVWR